MDDIIEKGIRRLEDNLLFFDRKIETVEQKRIRLIEEMEDDIFNKLKIYGTEKPKELEAKISYRTAYLSALTQSENNAKQRVLISLKNKELDIAEDTGCIVANLLKEINSKTSINITQPINSEVLDEELTKIISEQKITITKGELKTDSQDLEDD